MLKNTIFQGQCEALNPRIPECESKEMVEFMRFLLEKKYQEIAERKIQEEKERCVQAANAALKEAKALRSQPTLSLEDIERVLLQEDLKITENQVKKDLVEKEKFLRESTVNNPSAGKIPLDAAPKTAAPKTAASMFSGHAGRTPSTPAPERAPVRKEKKIWETKGMNRVLTADAPKQENIQYVPSFFSFDEKEYLNKAGPAYILSNGHHSKNRYDQNYVNDRTTSYVDHINKLDVLLPHDHLDGWRKMCTNKESSLNIFRLSKSNPFFFQLDFSEKQNPVWSVFLLNAGEYFGNNTVIYESIAENSKFTQIDVEDFVKNGCNRTKYE